MTKAAAKLEANDRILDGAARLFRGQGYAATSVRDVARAAGILPGSLHYRYANKEDLLVALMERAIDRLIAGVLEALGSDADPVERLRLGIRAHLRILLSGDDAVYVLLYDWRSLSSPAAAAVLRQRARYERFSDELIAQAAAIAPMKPGVDLHLLRQFGFGAVNWVAQWYEPGGRYTPDQIAEAFWQYTAFGALAGPWPPEPPKGVKRGTKASARKSRS